MRTLLLVLFLLSLFQACKIQKENTGTGKFAAYDSGFKSTLLIHAVHEPEWTIAYTIDPSCDRSRLPEDKVFEDAISRAIQMWLEPVKKVADEIDKSVAVSLNYMKLTAQNTKTIDDDIKKLEKDQNLLTDNKAKLSVFFICRPERSHARIDNYKRPFIRIYPLSKRRRAIGNSLFSFDVLLHETGHVFGLKDTYQDSKDDPPRTDRIKGQPLSIMSLGARFGNDLGEDDIKGIQWLYRYTHAKDTIPKENHCFFTDYERHPFTEECLPKHPLITLLRQAEAHDRLGNAEVTILILEETRREISTLLAVDISKINARDEDGNTALHLVVKYFLTSEKINTLQPSWWRSNNYPPRYWATVGTSLLHLSQCPHTNSSGEQRMLGLKLLYDRCVDRRNKYCVCIDPQIKNNEGKTARDLAVEANATDIVQTIDAALKRP